MQLLPSIIYNQKQRRHIDHANIQAIKVAPYYWERFDSLQTVACVCSGYITANVSKDCLIT